MKKKSTQAMQRLLLVMPNCMALLNSSVSLYHYSLSFTSTTTSSELSCSIFLSFVQTTSSTVGQGSPIYASKCTENLQSYRGDKTNRRQSSDCQTIPWYVLCADGNQAVFGFSSSTWVYSPAQLTTAWGKVKKADGAHKGNESLPSQMADATHSEHFPT